MVKDKNIQDFSFSPLRKSSSPCHLSSCWDKILGTNTQEVVCASWKHLLSLQRRTLYWKMETILTFAVSGWCSDTTDVTKGNQTSSESSYHCPVEQGWNTALSFVSSYLCLSSRWPAWGLCRAPGVWYLQRWQLDAGVYFKVHTEMFRFSWRRMWGVAHWDTFAIFSPDVPVGLCWTACSLDCHQSWATLGHQWPSDLHRCCTDVGSCCLGSVPQAPPASLCTPGRAVPVWGAWGMSVFYCFVFALGTKGAGGKGRIMYRIVVGLFIVLFLKFALLPVPCLSICKVEGGRLGWTKSQKFDTSGAVGSEISWRQNLNS